MEEQTQQPTNNTSDGVQPEAGSIVDRADSIAKRLEESEKRIDEKLKKIEELQARQILGGKSVAGQVVEKKEETPQEYAKRVMTGKL